MVIVSPLGLGGMTTAHLEQNTHLVGRMGPHVVFLDIGTNDFSSGYPIARLVERVLTAASIFISFYHVKQVVILEIFRRLPTGRYHCPFDSNDRVVSYNTLLKQIIDAAGPRYTRTIQFHHHQGLVENWQQYLLADGVHLNELGLAKYYRSLRRAVIKYFSPNIVGKFTP